MIPINFASRNYRRRALAHVALITTSIVLAAAVVAMVWTAISLRRNIASAELKLKELETADGKILATLQEREKLVKDLSQMSSLMASKSFSWTKMLTRLEGVVPIGVALQQVDFNPGDHTLILKGDARSPDALRNLLVGLENSSSFKNPTLKHQSLEKGSNQFNVVAVYREDTGPAAAQRKSR